MQYQPPDLKRPDTEWEQSNVLVNSWAKELANDNSAGWTCIEHCDFTENFVQHVLESTRSTNSHRRVIYLENFFMQYEWLIDWKQNMADFLEVKPSCCSASPPPEAVVIHLVNTPQADDRFEKFEIEGQEYERLLQKIRIARQSYMDRLRRWVSRHFRGGGSAKGNARLECEIRPPH